MPVTWSDEKLILLYCSGRGSNSRPPAHRSFKHGQGVLSSYPLGHGGGCSCSSTIHVIADAEYLTKSVHSNQTYLDAVELFKPVEVRPRIAKVRVDLDSAM